MTFTLTLSGADLLLLLPEMLLTVWLCVVLTVDFAMPRLPKDRLAYLSAAGLAGELANLVWFDRVGIGGTLFAHIFVVDRLVVIFKLFIVARAVMVIVDSVDYIWRFRVLNGERSCLI